MFILFPLFSYIGLALAASAAAWVNALLLLGGLYQNRYFYPDGRLLHRLGRILVASVLMALILWGLSYVLTSGFEGSKILSILTASVLVVIGVSFYGLCAIVLKATKISELKSEFTRNS